MTLRTPPSIEGYGPSGFRISGVWRTGSVLIVDDVVRPFAPLALRDVLEADLVPALSAVDVVEFLLLGVGARAAPAPSFIRSLLIERRIGLEVASTPEACRLYNILAGEGRRIAAALIVV